MGKGDVQKGYHCAWQIHYHIVFPVKYRKVLLDKMVIRIIEETAYGIPERYAIEIEALGMDKDHIHLLSSAHPKISPGGMVRIFKSITAREIFRRYPKIKKELCVENFGLMDIMLPLLVREGTGQKWKSIYKSKVNRRKI